MKQFATILVCLCLAFLGSVSAAQSITDEAAVELVIQRYQEGCNSVLEEFRDIDADLDEPVIAELIIDEASIYEIALVPDGSTKGTVIYNDFGCLGDGLPVYPWCGTGGCGFEIVVHGVIYESMFGGRPFSVTAQSPFPSTKGDLTVVLIPIYGSGCEDAVGSSGAGYQTCIVSAWWDPDFNTFRSRHGEIRLSGLNR